MQKQLANRLAKGQRIYANGTIRYFDFVGQDEKPKKSAVIFPQRLHICGSNLNGDNQSSDINEVKLFGRVTNPAYRTESSTFLDVTTHFFDRYELISFEFHFVSSI